MSGYEVKVYIVQRASGEVIAAKLRLDEAVLLRRQYAPARLLFAKADKTLLPNVSDYGVDQSACK